MPLADLDRVDGDRAHRRPPAMMSSATPSGPVARPCASLESARLMASASAPCWTAKLQAMPLSRALVSAELFDL
jgi:hypothetical protein